MIEDSGKSAVGSVGFWGGLIAALTGLAQIAQPIIDAGVLSPHASPYVVAASGIAAVLGRLFASKEITSVLPKKAKSKK